MFELSEESELLSAGDGSVVLTTHRVIVTNEKDKNQVMLTDFISYKIDRHNIGNYNTLAIIFFVLMCLSGIGRELSNAHQQQILNNTGSSFLKTIHPDDVLLKILTYLFGFLLLTSLLLRRLGTRVIVYIIGKYNQLQFRVRDEKVVTTFINRLVEESEKRKQEQVLPIQ
jgi:hypothetical protein